MNFKFQFPGGKIEKRCDHSLEDAIDFICANFNCEENDFAIWEA